MTAVASSEDKWAVVDVLYRYAEGIDRRDWPLYRSIFADEAVFDFSSYNAKPPMRITGAAWVDGVIPLFTGLEATQHSMSNPRVMVDGDHATCTMYMQAHHVLDPTDPESYYTIGGYYDDTLERQHGQWLLTGVQLIVTWQRGNPAIMDAARKAGLTKLASGH